MATNADIYAGLNHIFRDVFGDDALTVGPQTTADQVPGWDSIKMVSIIIAVEQHFDVKLRSREVDQLKTVGDLAAVVKTKLG